MNYQINEQDIFQLKQAVIEYITQNPRNEVNEKLLTNELDVFSREISTIFTGDDKVEYTAFMTNCALSGIKLANEADLLEYVIPIWATSRGKNIPEDKSVDSFYYELEMLILFNLLANMTRDTLTAVEMVKLRAIIRRYSNLPEVWKFVCAMSGDEVVDAYTF